MVTVLVTGGNGFLGRHLVRRLSSLPNTRVVALTRQSLGPSAVLNVGCALEHLTRDVWRAHGIKNFETIFHFAGFAPKSAADINCLDDVYRSTIAGTYSLLKSLPSAPRNFIYSSSIDVYGAAQGIITEQSPTRPNGLHGASKLFCEAMIGAAAASDGFRKVILRYGHLYGPGEDAYRKAIPNFIRAVLRGEQPTVSADAAHTMRDFLFVQDAVEAAVRAASNAAKIHDVINVVSGHSTPIRGALRLVLELKGMQAESEADCMVYNDRVQYDNRTMLKLLGAWPLVSLGDGLAQEFAYMESLARLK